MVDSFLRIYTCIYALLVGIVLIHLKLVSLLLISSTIPI
jgi:hypothetical protein